MEVLEMNKSCSLFLIIIFLVGGCQSSFGPRALKHSHPAYNQVIVNTLSQEMLLNLVRLKYRDRPFFLKVGSVTATFSMGADIGVEGEYGIDWKRDIGDGRVVSPSVGVSYSQSPTISYTPLQGEAFLKSVLTPISLEALLVIAQSGWSVERVFGICVERVNNLYNAPSASGPTPEEEPRYREFGRMLEILRILQVAGLLEIGFDLESVENSNAISLHIDPKPDYQDLINEFRSLLEVSQQANQFKITTNFLHLREKEVDVRPRAIYTVLHYLSQNVEIPEEHKESGLITVTKAKGGGEFNWDETPAGRVFKVRCNKSKPENAFVAVPYRGAWFYIADDDLQSKSTFMLLSQLFNLQAGQTEDAGPTLTLPVGGR